MAAFVRPFSLVALAIWRTDAWRHTTTALSEMWAAQASYIKATVKPRVESAVP